MSIWHGTPTVETVSRLFRGTMMDTLDMTVTGIGDDHIVATMPVDERTRQPFGLLHGGASAALAETLASVGANCTLDPDKSRAVGLNITASHVRPALDGRVTGTARAVHRGRSTQVWDVDIRDDAGRTVCLSRVTMAIVPASE